MAASALVVARSDSSSSDQAQQWETLKSMVLDSVTSPHTKRAYERALEDFLTWFQSEPGRPFTKAAVQSYRSDLETRGLAPSSTNIRLSAVRKLAMEATDNGLLAPELAAGIARVKGTKRCGVRLGNWLTEEQAEELLSYPDGTTLKGKRDRALLAVMIGSGLRRAEIGRLTLEHIQRREGRWVIIDLIGKHGRVRTVPIPDWAKEAVDDWTQAANVSNGCVFRPVNKSDRMAGQRLTAQGVFDIVKRYASILGVTLRPHDIRRTYARLAYKGRAPLEQIQLSLGHASIVTTEIYLGTQQNLQDAPCDHLGLVVRFSDTSCPAGEKSTEATGG